MELRTSLHLREECNNQSAGKDGITGAGNRRPPDRSEMPAAHLRRIKAAFLRNNSPFFARLNSPAGRRTPQHQAQAGLLPGSHRLPEEQSAGCLPALTSLENHCRHRRGSRHLHRHETFHSSGRRVWEHRTSCRSAAARCPSCLSLSARGDR
jgi:hypothetical protein